ncbi:MAG TPA: DUF3054 domain-containing protein [Pseudonocardiaceae bacterium]
MTRSVAIAASADVLAVLVFAAVGRRTHGEEGAVVGLLATAGPFLVGLALAWALARAWRAPLALRTAALVWPVTVVAGLVVRAGVIGRLPLSFALVVALSLGVLLLGWRAAAAAVEALVARSGGHGSGVA